MSAREILKPWHAAVTALVKSLWGHIPGGQKEPTLSPPQRRVQEPCQATGSTCGVLAPGFTTAGEGMEPFQSPFPTWVLLTGVPPIHASYLHPYTERGQPPQSDEGTEPWKSSGPTNLAAERESRARKAAFICRGAEGAAKAAAAPHVTAPR